VEEKDKKFIAVTIAGTDENGQPVKPECALIRLAHAEELINIFRNCLTQVKVLPPESQQMPLVQTLMMLAGEVLYRRELHGELEANSDVIKLVEMARKAQAQPPSKFNPHNN
jgi:hypothetical protein